MPTWWFYSLDTGRFDGRAFTGPATGLDGNTPPGCGAADGVADWRSQCVDLDTGAVIPWQPPAPPDDEWQTWAWDAGSARWAAAPTLAALQRDRIAPVLAAILAEEARQARPLRELRVAELAGQPAPQQAIDRLQQIDAAIVALRAVRSAMLATTTPEELASIVWP